MKLTILYLKYICSHYKNIFILLFHSEKCCDDRSVILQRQPQKAKTTIQDKEETNKTNERKWLSTSPEAKLNND